MVIQSPLMPEFRIIKKDIYLNHIKKGASSKLTCKIKVQIERHHKWTEDFKDTVLIAGNLNAGLD